MSRLLLRTYPLALAAIGAIASCAVYSRLPETMAVHWDLNGNPNGWMPRPVGALAMPAFVLVLAGLMRAAPRNDPSGASHPRVGDTYELVVASALLLVLVTHFVILAIALGYHLPVTRIAIAMSGALFVVIGSVMPRTRSHWAMGIRTPWTLSSERVWMRTHRLAGVTMIGAGIVMIVASMALSADLLLPTIISAVVAGLIAPVMYSYLTWRREQQR